MKAYISAIERRNTGYVLGVVALASLFLSPTLQAQQPDLEAMLTELQKQVEQQQEMLEAQDRRLGDQDQRLEAQERRICCGCKDGHHSHGNRESHQSGNTGTDQRRRPEDLYRCRLQEQRRHAQAAARLWTIPGLKSQQTIDGPGGGSGAGSTDSVFGWGVTMSGRKDLQWSDYGSAILGQITYGRGIGRYINDLGTIGGGDAVFDESGTLHALPVFAGYASLQYGWPTSHWPGTLRSNVTYSWVSLDNYDLQQPADYRSTYRAAINILYYPVSHARIGAEFLWGRRRNVDGSAGAANSCSSRCATASEPLASSRARTELAPPGLSGIFAFLAPALAEDSTAMTFYGHAMMDMGYPTNQSDPNWFDVARPMKLSSFEGEFGDDGSWFTTVR